jgi:hypothetical protein
MDLSRLTRKSALNNPFCGSMIVTDFSWANIHSIFHELNDASNIDSYLSNTFDTLVQGRPWTPCTGVFLCVNHVIHIIAKKTSQLLTKREHVRCLFLNCFALIQYSETFDLTLNYVENLLCLFGSPFKSKEVKEARANLDNGINKWLIQEKVEQIQSSISQFKMNYNREKVKRNGSGKVME